MHNSTHLSFLEEKIMDLSTALFTSESDSVLKLPTTIVKAQHVDQLGNVWLVARKPQQFLHEFDRHFPVNLNFFHKGKGYFLRVSGNAYMVHDPEELTQLSLVSKDLTCVADDELVLIKVRMTKAEYFESVQSNLKPVKAQTAIGIIVKKIYSWIFNTRQLYRPYSLVEAA